MRLSVIILFGILTEAWGQISLLETNNPIPRQGDEVQIEFTIDKRDLTELRDKEKKSNKEYNRLWNNNVGKGSLKITQIVCDTGRVTIGPFSFTLDDTTYVTNTLTLNVLPKLPGNIRNGIWIRHTEINDIGYLIIEQRVSRGPQKKTDSHGTSISLNNEGITFADLDREKFEKLGFKVISSSSSSSIQTVDEVGDDLFSDFVNYHKSTYTFEKANLKGTFKIDKDLFVNLAKTGHYELIAVKN
ncbi:MAG: BatD family protein [Bacteroidota bacterium]